jgi:hypothetical protein
MFGLLLLLPLAYEYWRVNGRRLRWSALWLALVPSGVAAYALYCRVSTGDWLAFVHAQNHWHRAYSPPGLPQWHAIRLLGDNPLLSSQALLYLQQLVLLAAAVTAVVLMVVGPWRLRPDQRYLTIYSAALLLPLLITEVGPTDPLGSVHRFLLEIIPIFLILARIAVRETLDRALLLSLMSLNVINMLTFLNKTTFVA